MSQENVELVRGLYSAFSRRDRAAIRQILHSEVVADMSRSIGPEKGVYEGIEALGRLLDAYWDAMEIFEIVPVELIDTGNLVVVGTQGKGVGRASRVEVNAKGGHLLGVQDGKIANWTVFQSKAEALEAAGLSE